MYQMCVCVCVCVCVLVFITLWGHQSVNTVTSWGSLVLWVQKSTLQWIKTLFLKVPVCFLVMAHNTCLLEGVWEFGRVPSCALKVCGCKCTHCTTHRFQIWLGTAHFQVGTRYQEPPTQLEGSNSMFSLEGRRTGMTTQHYQYSSLKLTLIS